MTPPEKFTSEVLPPSRPPRISTGTLSAFPGSLPSSDSCPGLFLASREGPSGHKGLGLSGTQRVGHLWDLQKRTLSGAEFLPQTHQQLGPPPAASPGRTGTLGPAFLSMVFPQARRAERTLPGAWRRSARTWHVCRREGGEVTEGKGLLSCERWQVVHQARLRREGWSLDLNRKEAEGKVVVDSLEPQ